jgi:hypothetical protein
MLGGLRWTPAGWLEVVHGVRVSSGTHTTRNAHRRSSRRETADYGLSESIPQAALVRKVPAFLFTKAYPVWQFEYRS